MRGGSSRKHAHFIVEAVNRTRRAGATGPSGPIRFWSYRLVEELDDMGVEWSITLSQYRQVREVAHITEDGWEPIGYTEDGEAQVAETSFVASKKKGKSSGAGGGAPHPAGSHPSATVARLALRSLRAKSWGSSLLMWRNTRVCWCPKQRGWRFTARTRDQ